MKERSLIFTGKSIPLILDGTKTMDRRIGDRFDNWKVGDLIWVRETCVFENTYEYDYDIRYIPTDRPIKKMKDSEGTEYYLIPHYRATEPEPYIVPEDLEDDYDDRTRWKPSIHMPKWACRIWLRIVGIQRERLQEITFDDIEKEGFHISELVERKKLVYLSIIKIDSIFWFKNFWDSLHKKPEHKWEANPYVSVISFIKINNPND